MTKQKKRDEPHWVLSAVIFCSGLACGSRTGLEDLIRAHVEDPIGPSGQGQASKESALAGAPSLGGAGVGGQSASGGALWAGQDGGVPAVAGAGGQPTQCEPIVATDDTTCDLGILLDHSASMASVRSGSGRTRCEDAARHALAVLSHFRCGVQASGAGTCPNGATDDPPVVLLPDGTLDTFDVVFSNPFNECASAARRRVNVFTFGDGTGLRSVTRGIGGGADGWVPIASECGMEQVIARLADNASGCSGLTPLADALCDVFPFGHPANDRPSPVYPGAKLLLLTDGVDTASSGPCSGKDDSDGELNLDRDSWQERTYMAWVNVVPAPSWSLQVSLFTPDQTIAMPRDPETGELVATHKRAAFLQILAVSTDGNLAAISDDAKLLDRVAPSF